MRALLKRLQETAVLVVRMALGTVAGFAVFAASGYVLGEGFVWIGWFLLMPLYSFMAVLIHEFGHAAGAWRGGMRVRRIVVARMAYSPKTRRWSKAKRPRAASDIGGWVEADEPLRGASRWSETLFAAGGPAANLATALLCLTIGALPMPEAPSIFLRSFGVFSLVLAVTNLIPWRLNGAASDGLQLWRIWRPHGSRKHAKPTRSGWKRTPDF